ncbi:alpha/beta fold hydrolase [Allobranchiibius huperziae]|uniref:ABC-2 type transport system ATP-binding protein n=1 Tax=Allobranchiibius huperziae TaxID=1874116 RepID=A0A853D8I7_9MICO|nr:alpha/beta fold hydrolase [Allobranchiibius huperziae]NYJ73502.1 ABC-2 type transport system ATP-binding protein [Allobranchiibius huperziae]
MKLPRTRIPRSRAVRGLLAAFVVLALAVGGIALFRPGSPHIATRSQFVTGTPEGGTPVRLDTTVYLPAKTPAPAILLAHGFGGSKTDLAGEARSLAADGYVVLAYTARGFGRSGGLIHLDAPDYEVADARLLVSYLAAMPQVIKDHPGDPRIGVAGSSYGGGLALLQAGTDRRIDAVGADITWNDLSTALFPNAAQGHAPGVFKKLWAGQLFGAAAGRAPSSNGCGRFAADVCAAYQQAAATGRPDATILSLLQASSPARVLSRITAPTLLSQGQQDSLFDLSQADANARGIAAAGTPTKVIWRSGGHDGGTSTSQLVGFLRSWFDPILKHGRVPDRSFTASLTGAALSSQDGSSIDQTVRIEGGYGANRQVPVALSGASRTIFAPAGGNPAAVTAVPGLGGLLGQAAGLAGVTGATQLASIPGQFASFSSAPLTRAELVAGSSTVQLRITARTTTDATLFASLHDVAPDGSDTLPSGLVAPIRLTGLRPGVPTTVTVRLPGIVQSVPAGHRVVVRVATTDLAYQLPTDARSYDVALASPQLGLSTAVGRAEATGHPWPWLIVGLVAMGLFLLGVAFAAVRRRRRHSFEPALQHVPVSIEHLSKVYSDGYRAVDDVTFSVQQGQVVGLLGPNGAGKTTLLRTLMGLIAPTTGSIRLFGELIGPGAAVLSRTGAFIEGPGLLPHLSGRDNLRLFWAATGRPEEDADFETALEIAGLGPSIERRVKTYSQGMRQRLAIAQAMLGLPEVLILDEPANGLDPPQIIEMREVLRRYAETGRTVVLSSHLLDEVEQTCTHVVVMHNGRLITAGSVEEIVGAVAGPDRLRVADPERAVRVLADAGIEAQQVATRHSLEEVFMQLVGADE